MAVTFEPADVAEALARTLHSFPLEQTPEARDLLHSIAIPVLEELPPHLRCEETAHALMTVFTMGLAAGAEVRQPRRTKLWSLLRRRGDS